MRRIQIKAINRTIRSAEVSDDIDHDNKDDDGNDYDDGDYDGNGYDHSEDDDKDCG
jgi:hypothetical protein